MMDLADDLLPAAWRTNRPRSLAATLYEPDRFSALGVDQTLFATWCEDHASQRHDHLDRFLPHVRLQSPSDVTLSVFELPRSPFTDKMGERTTRMWFVTRDDETTVHAPFVPFELGTFSTSDEVTEQLICGGLDLMRPLMLHSYGQLSPGADVSSYIRNEWAAACGQGFVRTVIPVVVEGQVRGLRMMTHLDEGRTRISLLDHTVLH